MDKKYGAYICTGCGIGDALDIEALTEVVSGEMSMECKTHQALCSADGRALIEADMNDNGVNTIVVGACSPRVMQNEFDFGDDKITIRANLREQVVWAEVKPAEGEEPHAEAAEFLNETQLQPEQEIVFTVPGRYMEIECQILSIQQTLENERGESIRYRFALIGSIAEYGANRSEYATLETGNRTGQIL